MQINAAIDHLFLKTLHVHVRNSPTHWMFRDMKYATNFDRYTIRYKGISLP